MKLFKNIKLITPWEVLNDYGVLINNGKIVNIELVKNIDLKSINEVVDGKGLYLSPGFIDIHNHGNSGNDFMDATDEAIENISKYHLENGVTSFLGTIITQSYDKMIDAADNIAKYKNHKFSQLLGIHFEGPFFSYNKKGAQPKEFIKEIDMSFVRKIVGLYGEKLKMISIAPEKENATKAIEYLKDNNIVVAMAHTDATYTEAVKGIDSGATIATHLYNGMRNFSHREPGIIGASLADERVFCEVIYDRIHIHDIAVKIALKMKSMDRIILVSDSMRATGLNDGIYELGGQDVVVNEGAARLRDGSLAGSTLNLRKAVYNMVKYLNVPICDAVRMASLTPAKAIKIDNEKGSIQVGKDADFIMHDEDINIKSVFIAGNTIDITKK